MSQEPSTGTYFLGRYRVVDEIGIGGMASVHLARLDGPGGFQRWVAIKRIHSHLIEDESFVLMFLDEARVAARISHPNVASVIELGKHQDSYWIAMEYLHGEPLREVMRRTEELGAPMPPEIACRIIADAAEGLHAAHELQGPNNEKLELVHRDVTPHNLFVTYDGSTKVVDFGIAKFLTRMSNTRHGTLKGKIAYMSPEQVHGENIDRRTDLFALGVCLWELTTGKRLFRMESDLDTLAKVQECNVPKPSTIIRGYPLDLEKIVLKALAKKKDDRFKTARELSRALQGLLMRRGLFIAGDEVASYMQSIFTDRIQKRDAHLRWAAEVTQTINIDRGGPGPKLDTHSALLVVPDAPPADPKPAVPRPAAGAPPQRSQAPAPGKASAGGNTGSSNAQTAQRPPPQPANAADSSEPYYEDGPTIMDDAPIDADYPTGDDEEYDDTIITTTRVDNQPVGGPKPLPAAGRPAADLQNIRETSRPPARPQNEVFAPLGGHVVPPRPAAGEPSTGSGPVSLGPLLQQPQAMQQPVPTAPFAPTPLGVGTGGPAAPQMILPTVPRVAVPPMRRGLGLPPWAVAVLSGILVLLLVTVIYGIFSSSPRQKQIVLPQGPVPGGGPFAAARTAFTVAITPRTTSATTPGPIATPPPPASASPDAGAPKAAVAKTDPPKVDPPKSDAPKPAPRPAPPAAGASGGGGGPTGTISIFCKRGGKPIDCGGVYENGNLQGVNLIRTKMPTGEHRLTIKVKNPNEEKTYSVIIVADQLKTLVADFGE